MTVEGAFILEDHEYHNVFGSIRMQKGYLDAPGATMAAATGRILLRSWETSKLVPSDFLCTVNEPPIELPHEDTLPNLGPPLPFNDPAPHQNKCDRQNITPPPQGMHTATTNTHTHKKRLPNQKKVRNWNCASRSRMEYNVEK